MISEDDIIYELRLMEAENQWPLWPVLPVKHRTRKQKGGFPTLGVILSPKPIVYVGVLIHGNMGNLEDAKQEAFKDWRELIEAGWRGD